MATNNHSPERISKAILLTGIAVVITLLLSCSKQEDYSWMNQDRRPQVIVVSERYTNPPSINPNGTWRPYKIVYDSLSRDIDIAAYIGQKPDTIKSTCSIDKVDSLFRIEIRKYEINYFKR